MKHRNTGRIAAGVLAASLVLQGSAMTALAEDVQETQAALPETAAAEAAQADEAAAETTAEAEEASSEAEEAAEETAAEDVLSITGSAEIPETIAQGTPFSVTGTVTSSGSTMTTLTVGVYDPAGKFVTGKTIAPRVKTYDLSRLDRYVKISGLTPGKYYYCIMASNAASSNYSLVTKPFTVTGSGSAVASYVGAAEDKLTISGSTTVPSTLTQGKAVNVTGIVTSASSNMTALTVGVYDSDSKFVTGRTINPAAKSYDLRKLDNYVAFNTLAPGKYHYAVIATNASNTNYTLVNQTFTVSGGSSSNTADGLTITGASTVPDNLAKGGIVNVRGTVTSASSNMTALTVGVYDSNARFITGRTINPNARTYDISRLDAYVAFNTLGAGTYTYAVIASNASNTNYTLVNKKFTVGGGSSSSTSDTLTITGASTVPDTIAVGKAVSVRGTVTSASSNMTTLTVGVYDANNKFVTGRTINPAAKSYDLSRLDAYVTFNKLSAGSYKYAVIASNASNTNYTLVNKAFTVGSGSTSSTSDALTITGSTSVPDTIAVGKAIAVRGTVTSASSNMTSLTVGVYDANAKFVTGRTINPGTKTYDLSRLDAYVTFNTLPAGTYTYAVIASNAANRNYALVNKKFTVGSGSSSSSTSTVNDALTISGGTSLPSTLSKGAAVIVRGKITSGNTNITSVSVGIYNSSGDRINGAVASPNAKSYDLNKLDSQIRFDRLAAGTYNYCVMASNNSNTGYMLVNQTFTVR